MIAAQGLSAEAAVPVVIASTIEVARTIGVSSQAAGAKTARELAEAAVVQVGGEMAPQEVPLSVLVKLFRVAVSRATKTWIT